ncbi:hypothetical protein K0M31_016945 [Melipona bicolor]|uniref:Uncharacterized protein n=1 Tax=Melipona bicolor TaxID=60889 RepID=A0AA40FDR6_9HYME|nr:hypothetical protein K0M31_016945 [Melipona bicolor]
MGQLGSIFVSNTRCVKFVKHGLPHFANYPTTVRHDLCGEPPPARFCNGQDLWFSEDAAPLHLKRNKLSVQGILVAHCNSHTVTPCVLLAQVATAFFYADITRVRVTCGGVLKR